MKGKFALANLIAVVAGIGCGQLTCQSTSCRDAIGRACGRGHLLALAHSQGIYEADIGRAVAEFRMRDGRGWADSNQTTQSRTVYPFSDSRRVLWRNAWLYGEKVPASDIERELGFCDLNIAIIKHGQRRCGLTVCRNRRFEE